MHKEHSIRSYSKDISEAHEAFYKPNEELSHTSMVHKEKEKHKGHISCEQKKNQGILIIVEEERWDANRGMPKLRCLSIFEIFTWGALGIPKLELLPVLILLISITPRSLNTSSTQNLAKKNLVRSVSIMKQITTFRY